MVADLDQQDERRYDGAIARELANALLRVGGVQVAYLLGTGVRRALRFESDIDVGVASSNGPLDRPALRRIATEMTGATGRPADVIDLRLASVPILRAALVDGRRLFCLDRDLPLALLRRLVYETGDFLPYQRRLLERRCRRWIAT